MEKTKELLTRISRIVESDRKIQEERRARGEKFNVFSVFGLYSQEVQLHSRMLAGLLDVRGDHGMKDAFIKAFTQVTNIAEMEFDSVNCDTQVEYHIGKRTETEGGRIDILLKAGVNAIIIENKINAGDQKNQLLRYHNDAKKKYGDYRLLYLTLDEKEASAESLGKSGGIEYIPISYRKHIRQWLERCIELSARQPLVRETLIQYLGIINCLTHQDMDTAKKQEIINLILDNYSSAKQISEHFSEAQTSVLDSIKGGVVRLLQESLGTSYDIESVDSFRSPVWIKPRNVIYQGLFFGAENFLGNSKGHFEGGLFVGIFDDLREKRDGGIVDSDKLAGDDSAYFSEWWINVKKITAKDNLTINLANPELISRYHMEGSFRKEIVEQIATVITDYVKSKETALINLSKT